MYNLRKNDFIREKEKGVRKTSEMCFLSAKGNWKDDWKSVTTGRADEINKEKKKRWKC